MCWGEYLKRHKWRTGRTATWNIWGGRTKNTLKQQKMVTFVSNCSMKMTLRLFWSLSVAMTMVPTLLRQFRRSLDQKDYHKCSSCVIVCWIAKTYQSTTMKTGWLLTYLDTSGAVKKPQKLHRKMINDLWWVLSTIKMR